MPYYTNKVFANDNNTVKEKPTYEDRGFTTGQRYEAKHANNFYRNTTSDLRTLITRTPTFRFEFHRGRGNASGLDWDSRRQVPTQAGHSGRFYNSDNTNLSIVTMPRGEYHNASVDNKLPFNPSVVTSLKQTYRSNSRMVNLRIYNPADRLSRALGRGTQIKEAGFPIVADDVRTELNQWWARVVNDGFAKYTREYDSSADKYFLNELVSGLTIVEDIPFQNNGFNLQDYIIIISNVRTVWANIIYKSTGALPSPGNRETRVITGFDIYDDPVHTDTTVTYYEGNSNIAAGIRISTRPFANPFNSGFWTWFHKLVGDQNAATFLRQDHSFAFTGGNGAVLSDMATIATFDRTNLDVPSTDSVWNTQFDMTLIRNDITIP